MLLINQLDFDEYEHFYDDASNGIELTSRSHNILHHHYDYDTMVRTAVGDVDLSDISDANEPLIANCINRLRRQINRLFPYG